MMEPDESMIVNPNLVLNDPVLLRNLELVTFECDYIKICKEPYENVVFERHRDWFSCMTFKTDGIRTVVEQERFGRKVILYQTDDPISFQSE